jgi:hypothetical protein
MIEHVANSAREEYLYAVEMARALHDPATDWDGFRDTLWAFLIRVFGLEDGEAWPGDIPDPSGQVSGDADAVAAWMLERMEPDQSSMPMPRS